MEENNSQGKKYEPNRVNYSDGTYFNNLQPKEEEPWCKNDSGAPQKDRILKTRPKTTGREQKLRGNRLDS